MRHISKTDLFQLFVVNIKPVIVLYVTLLNEQAYPSNKFNTEVTVDGNFYHFKSPGR